MFAENLNDFLDSVEGFALDGTYDGATAVKVIVDNEYDEMSQVAGTMPVAVGLASVFPAAAVGKTLLLTPITWTIRGREPIDDGAFVRLRLSNG